MNLASHITLSQLNSLIGDAISGGLERSYWLVAEIAELRENYSGHCYLSIVEKEDEKILAQSKASIWQQTYRMVKPYFESATGQALTSGIKVRIKVSVSFHNVYGINLTVQDIDPAYTVGELTIRRQQIYKELVADGVAEMNKDLEMPILSQRIAIISSPTAAGYEDFMNQLGDNNFSYTFNTRLFPAVMQGDGAEASIINAIGQIFDELDHFDVVVLIRGGGASADLACFDNYNIAYHLTQMPIPVVVGIGHERDETVLDMVAHTALKTPTAVAAFFIETFQSAEHQVDMIMERMQVAVRQLVVQQKQRLYNVTSSLPILSSKVFAEKKIQLNQMTHLIQAHSAAFLRGKNETLNGLVQTLQKQTSDILTTHQQKLDKASVMAEYADPKQLLAKGYSITTHNGVLIKSTKGLKSGDKLRTMLDEGEVKSVVE